MNLHIEKGRKGDFWADQLPEGISLLRGFDKCIIVAAAISFIVIATYLLYEDLRTGGSPREVVYLISAPFFICGIIFYLRVRALILLIIVIAAVILLFAGLPQTVLFLLLFLFVGAAGVVAVVDALQRAIFYHILRTIEYINVKRKLTFRDKVVAFMFNVPKDMDARNITMDYELDRTKIPWREVGNSISFGLMIGMFIWIYLSMNPAFMDISSENSVSLLMFTLILYIPIIVLPWAIFRSLNVRIETNYRDFKVYSGIQATLQRMAVPIVAALFYVLVAINTTDIYTVLFYMLLSALMIVAVMTFVSILYYWAFEAVIINDIISKWRLFRPVPIFVGLDDDEKKRSEKDIPGTPKRDMDDFGELALPEER